jgi:protein-tyrosine-phosphatase
MKKNILVVCDDNTLYSKIAEAYFKKYGGHWKNIFSAGVSIDGKKISPELLPLLEKNGLPIVDFKLMNVEDYASTKIDYVIALTKNAFDYCSNKQTAKEITIFSTDINSTDSIEKISEEIKDKALKFVKDGPIKRWLEQ